MLDLGRTFLQSADRSPHSLAIVDGALRLTYAQWYERVSAVVTGLVESGVGSDDHVVTIMRNCWQAATLHWACQFLGAIITPVNWRAKAEELDFYLRDAEARILFFDVEAKDAVQSLARSRELVTVPINQTLDKELIAFADWIARYATSHALPRARPAQTSVMLYTSGTTGIPKGVPRSHAAERAAAVAHVAQNRYTVGERALAVMPFYHTMGVRTLLSSALLDGCIVCMPRFDAGLALQLIESENLSSLYLVPTLYHDLLAHSNFDATKLRSVRKLGFAGAPMSESLLQRLNKSFQPQHFINHYGCSEIFTLAVNHDAILKPGSAGRAGLNSRLRVARLEATHSEQLAAAGEEGQIIADLISDEAFRGYWKRPEADAKALRDGWYFTGDTGFFDRDGDLFVTGRVDDMIISGGENISPADIESVLSLHPAVDEVAVAGLADERWGQCVTAFIKRKFPVDENDLDQHCRMSNIMSFKRPRRYLFVKEIPKSPVGKVLRRKLVLGEYETE